MEERGMFENSFANAVSMLLLFFGVTIAFIIFSAYLWSRERKKFY
jgi:ABC-type transport system involved in multi-copper enzyme maturation permease subunit